MNIITVNPSMISYFYEDKQATESQKELVAEINSRGLISKEDIIKFFGARGFLDANDLIQKHYLINNEFTMERVS